MTEQPSRQRPIRSYVLREGRLTSGQQRAFASLWPKYGVDFHGQQLDLPSLFGNNQPVYLEVGFGNGESLLRMAEANPDRNYLGIEVHRPGIGHLLLGIEQHGLCNLRLIRHDAVEVLHQSIGNASLAGVFLFFPDPWHKRRHHKRRILNPAFVKELTRVIQSGGCFHTATDWAEYAEQMMDILTATPEFNNIAGRGQFSPRPSYRPMTRFELRGQRLGQGARDLIFQRH
jgi:tRNA (guanine-N7-)-methyltransferase